jgi:hypothetical protein
MQNQRSIAFATALQLREIATDLFSRHLYADLIECMDDKPLEEIAALLNKSDIPKLRGDSEWTASCVGDLRRRAARTHKGFLRVANSRTANTGSLR